MNILTVFLKAGSFTLDVFAFFRPLYTKQIFLVCTGEMIKGTGQEDLLSFYGLSTVGLSTAMCDVNYIKKAAVYKSKDFYLWCKEQEEESFIYFFGILKHLLNINQLVRSIREASFDLFVASLKQLCPLLFALHHIHYSRWIPVFILDLKLLNVSDPAHYHSFSKGYFVARKLIQN